MKIETPTRVAHRYRLHIHAPPDAVFPLLCPVREAEWVDGWDPPIVYTKSGVAEAGCVFIAPDGDREAVWTITEYDPAPHRIAFVKVTPGYLVVQIHITLHTAPDDSTHADVQYTYTALSDEGKEAVQAMTPEAYEAFMHEWEEALNGYLRELGRR